MAYKYSSRRLLSARNEDEDSYRRAPSPSRLSLAERLRATADKYSSSSLPNRHEKHRSSVRNSDSDIPSRLTQSQAAEEALSTFSSSRNRVTDTKNYKKLYEENQVENERLRSELTDAQRKISELQSRLEKAEDTSMRRIALDNEKRERRALERKLAEMEQELQVLADLKADNQRLKDENGALIRVISKLSK